MWSFHYLVVGTISWERSHYLSLELKDECLSRFHEPNKVKERVKRAEFQYDDESSKRECELISFSTAQFKEILNFTSI
jgi:hypothetical protein